MEARPGMGARRTPRARVWWLLAAAIGPLACAPPEPADDTKTPNAASKSLGAAETRFTVWRPSTGNWHSIRIIDGHETKVQWGVDGDRPLRMDFDGDGAQDNVIWRPHEANWYLRGRATETWQRQGDIPVPGEWDNWPDGKDDIAVWRPSDAKWYLLRSRDGISTVQWGAATDVPAPADFDGDGTLDFTIWRPTDRKWYVRHSSRIPDAINEWGVAGDVLVPADYDGDRKADRAIWRPSSGEWWIHRSTDGGVTRQGWGLPGDVPMPYDYDADGRVNLTVWRPSSGNWYVFGHSDGLKPTGQWGQAGDVPVGRSFAVATAPPAPPPPPPPPTPIPNPTPTPPPPTTVAVTARIYADRLNGCGAGSAAFTIDSSRRQDDAFGDFVRWSGVGVARCRYETTWFGVTTTTHRLCGNAAGVPICRDVAVRSSGAFDLNNP